MWSVASLRCSETEVGVLDEYFDPIVVADQGKNLCHEPCDEFRVAADLGRVVAEQVHARIIEMTPGRFDVATDHFPGLASEPSEQTDAVEMTPQLFRRQRFRDPFAKPRPHWSVECLNAAAEPDRGGSKLFGEPGELVTVPVMGFEPEHVNLATLDDFGDFGERHIIKFHCRTGVDHIKHTELASHLFEYRRIQHCGIVADIVVIIAEPTLLPETAASAQKYHLARQFGINPGIANQFRGHPFTFPFRISGWSLQ